MGATALVQSLVEQPWFLAITKVPGSSDPKHLCLGIRLNQRSLCLHYAAIRAAMFILIGRECAPLRQWEIVVRARRHLA